MFRIALTIIPVSVWKFASRRNLILTFIALGVVIVTISRFTISTESKNLTSTGKTAASRKSGSVRATAQTKPWVNFGDGYELAPPESLVESASPQVLAPRTDGLRPTALVSADVNEDGLSDLISAYADPTGGYLTIRSGKAEALAQPQSTESYAKEAKLIRVPETPDFVVKRDFDRDGKTDILVAARGGQNIYLLFGNGHGGFSEPQSMALPGTVTSMLTGEMADKDAAEVVIGTNAYDGPSILIYKAMRDVMDSKPITYRLSANATSIATGRLDDDASDDLAVIAEAKLLILHRGDSTTQDPAETRRDTEEVPLPFAVRAMAVGDFIWDRDSRMELAVVAEDGSVKVLSRGDLDTRPLTDDELRSGRQSMMLMREGKGEPSKSVQRLTFSAVWKVAMTAPITVSNGDGNLQPSLMAVLASGQKSNDLLIIDPSERKLYVTTRLDSQSGETAVETPEVAATLETDSEPIMALPVQLGGASRPGLAVLSRGKSDPTIVPNLPVSTYTVNNAGDTVDANPGNNVCADSGGQCTLRAAVMEANAHAGADAIIFSAALNGTPIQLTRSGDDNTATNGDLDINQDLTITGNGAANTIIQGSSSATFTGNMGDKVFGINQDGSHTTLNVTISDLTVRFTRNDIAVNGAFTQTGGAMDIFLTGTGAMPGPTTTLTNVTFNGNANSHSYGGAINIDSGSVPSTTNIFRGTVLLTGCTISNNKTLSTSLSDNPPAGGGVNIFGDKQNVTFTNCSVTGNQTSADMRSNAGGINMRVSNGGTITLTNTTVDNNIAGSDGGGILTAFVQTVIINGGSISGNTAQGTGDSATAGGFFSGSNIGVDTTLSGVTINNNIATAGASGVGGGVVDVSNSPLSLSNCTISGNSSDSGGGVATTATGVAQTTSITNSTISNNSAATGAGLLVSAGIMSVSGSAISTNPATTSGGALAITGSTGSASFSNNTISGNSATTSGGAFFVSNGTLTTSLNRIVNNTSAAGSGIARTGGTATVENNWWGCDGFPNAAGCQTGSGTFDADPRIDLRLTASPTSVLRGGTSTLTADVTKNTDGVNTNGGNAPTVLVGLNLTFDATSKGSINAPLTVAIPANGLVTKTFTANTNSAACGTALPSVTLDNGTQTVSIIIQCADLTVLKTNDVSNSAVVGQTWTWTQAISNASGGFSAAASFSNGQTILSDNLPNSVDISYTVTTPSIVLGGVNSGTINCSINGTKDLICTASGAVVIGVGGTFNVQWTAKANVVGTYANPRGGGGTSVVDPNDNEVESNEANNSSSNSVTVNKASTTTSITSDNPDPSVTGQSATVQWSVAVNAPGSLGAALTGNVTVSDGTNQCVAAVSAGQCNITFTTAGAKSITATYAGDTNYNGSASTPATSHTVNKADTTTSITSDNPDPSVTGQSVTVQWSVAVTAPGAVGAALTGLVTVSDGTNSCNAAVSVGQCNIVFTTAGAKSLTATYAGDGNYNGSASTPATAHTVNKADTTTSITSDNPDPSVTGQAVTVQWSVTVNAPGAVGAALTGLVTVSDGTNSCNAAVSVGQCNITFTTAGAKSLTATYAGDGNYNGSASTPATSHTVNAAGTTTTITSDNPDPSVTGQAVTVVWNVTVNAPGAVGASLTGLVTVSDGTDSCNAAVGVGQCNITFTTAGAKLLTATYAGDSNYNGSASTPATSHTVNAAGTTTTITADSPDPSSSGQSVSVNYTVVANAPGAGTPTGNVNVTVSGGAETCTGTVASGGCSLVLNTIAVGRTITATYVGDSNFTTSSDTELHDVGVANPMISVLDARVAEPATGTTNMVFTVTLSVPAAGATSVDFTTADQAPGAGHATAGSCGSPGADYVLTSGTVNFATGQQIKTINVPVCSDADTEPDETFLVNLSNAVGATIADNQAVGTITTNVAGTFLISEIRTSGPAGLGDDFVELYNNTDTPLTVAASDASAGYGIYKMGDDCNAAPVLIGTIPNGTVIPARAHYLMVGSQYSLADYGGTGTAAGDLTFSSDIESDRNVAVFSTADVLAISSVNRLDAVGFGLNTGGVCDLFREGSTVPPVSGSTTQHSFYRDSCGKSGGSALGACPSSGAIVDANNNNTDFVFEDTQGTFISGVPQRLGSPGPENLASPIRRDSTISVSLLDQTIAAALSPNRVRDFTSNPGNNSTFGTLSIRRRFTNNSGANVTRLRFRIVDISTFPSPGSGVADLRPITSTNVVVSGVNDAATCLASTGSATTPCTITVKGTTLEQPPAQPNGGGWNSTLSDGTITLGTPLANGASANLQFLLGIQTTGTFKFFIIVEALP